MTGAHGCAPVGSKNTPWRQGFKVEKLAIFDGLGDLCYAVDKLAPMFDV
jgi:hypothetical protein